MALNWSATRAIPTAMKMNSDYFVALARTFEEHYGVEFAGIRKGAGHRPARTADPVQDQHRCGDVAARPQRPGRLAGRSAGRRSATRSKTICRSRSMSKAIPFLDDRLRVANLPVEPQTVTVKNRFSGAEKQVAITSLPQTGRSRRRAPRRSPKSSSG